MEERKTICITYFIVGEYFWLCHVCVCVCDHLGTVDLQTHRGKKDCTHHMSSVTSVTVSRSAFIKWRASVSHRRVYFVCFKHQLNPDLIFSIQAYLHGSQISPAICLIFQPTTKILSFAPSIMCEPPAAAQPLKRPVNTKQVNNEITNTQKKMKEKRKWKNKINHSSIK